MRTISTYRKVGAFLYCVKSPGLYKGMSRTFFSLHRRRGFASRYPAPLTIRRRSWGCRAPGLFHLSSTFCMSGLEGIPYTHSQTIAAMFVPIVGKANYTSDICTEKGRVDPCKTITETSESRSSGCFHGRPIIFNQYFTCALPSWFERFPSL